MDQKIHFFGVIMAILAPVVFAQESFAQGKITRITGKTEYIRDYDVNMSFYWLLQKNGTKIFLGAPFEVDEDPSKACVSQSAENETEITLEGVLVRESEDLSFRDGKFRCVTPSTAAANKTESTEAYLVSVHAQEIGLSLIEIHEDGAEDSRFFVVKDKQLIENLFSKNEGNLIEINYIPTNVKLNGLEETIPMGVVISAKAVANDNE